MLHLSRNPFRVRLLDNFFPSDRKPGDIECITDIFFEDFKNFPQTRELGEESARFVREEMEKTWGTPDSLSSPKMKRKNGFSG